MHFFSDTRTVWHAYRRSCSSTCRLKAPDRREEADKRERARARERERELSVQFVGALGPEGATESEREIVKNGTSHVGSHSLPQLAHARGTSAWIYFVRIVRR